MSRLFKTVYLHDFNCLSPQCFEASQIAVTYLSCDTSVHVSWSCQEVKELNNALFIKSLCNLRKRLSLFSSRDDDSIPASLAGSDLKLSYINNIIISPDNKSVSPVLTTVVLSDYELVRIVIRVWPQGKNI